MWRCFGALIVLTLVGAVAHAGSKQDIADCSDWWRSDAIEVCTRALKSSNLNEGEQAGLYASRAMAHEREGRHAEAAADLGSGDRPRTL